MLAKGVCGRAPQAQSQSLDNKDSTTCCICRSGSDVPAICAAGHACDMYTHLVSRVVTVVEAGVAPRHAWYDKVAEYVPGTWQCARVRTRLAFVPGTWYLIRHRSVVRGRSSLWDNDGLRDNAPGELFSIWWIIFPTCVAVALFDGQTVDNPFTTKTLRRRGC